MAEEVLDLTKYRALCGDPLVHVMEKAKELRPGARLRVVLRKQDYELASKALSALEAVGLRIAESGCTGDTCAIVVEKTG